MLSHLLNQGVIQVESQEYLEYKQNISKYPPENISDVHPNHVVSLLCFIELLKQNDIYHIKVPILQVLSYDYHILLGNITKEKFLNTWNQEKLESLKYETKFNQEANLKRYEFDKIWYNHIVAKEDFISKTKIETFYRIIRRASYHNQEIRLLNEPLMEGDYLDIKISKTKKIEKILK